MKEDHPLEFHTPPSKIPHIFRNRDLTVPANPLLKEWLLFVLKYDPDLLKYLYRAQGRYVKFGGGNSYTFKRWCGKLLKDTTKTKF